MITQMKKYTFLVFHRDYEPFLEQLRELGVVHITQKAAGLIQDDEQLQAALQHEDELRRLLKQGAPDQLIQERAEVEQRIAEAQESAKKVAVWGDLDPARIAALREAGYALRFFECPTKAFREEWGIKVSEKEGKTYFVNLDNSISRNIDNSELLDKATELQQPEKSAAQYLQEVEHLKGLYAAADTRILAWQKANLDRIQQELVEARQQIDWTRVNLSTDKLAEGALCLFEGFCPIDREAELNAMLAESQVYYEETDPAKEDATPIKLHNNWFVRLFEPLTGMYGWPNYNEFDPTPILGPCFLLFFALCIGDCGYGLLLTLIGYLILKGKLKIEMFDGLGGIIMALGVGSTVIGYLMGTFFGIDIFRAEWFPQAAKAVMFNNLGVNGKIGEYDVMMVVALVIGVVHIILAMTIKAISYTKRDGFKNTVSTWGWLLLIVGGICTAILAMTFSLPTETVKWIMIGIGAVSALGIFVFNTPGRNPLINVGAGLWDTYQMSTGLLGDVLSYIRLYALGLAGGMLGAAFNQLGAQVLGENPNVGTWIGFILIVTFGHVLNLLMACLGAFVHPLRLSFVEYFKNAGYEGTGKLYQPFKK
ncbi:MAG: ATPase V [Paludibacteraceae bacterium]|nr:ATPase V [Paludibacteraceae bacterium]